MISPLRLAMLGMIPGNGHPCSWSAIVNGFDPVAMDACPYPVIRQYLGAQPACSVHLPGAQVTQLCGTAGQVTLRFTDTYAAFRGQLVNFIDYVRSGAPPYPFAETVELMAVLIAGLRSRSEDSRRVPIGEILAELSS
jgi:hypothetical protein